MKENTAVWRITDDQPDRRDARLGERRERGPELPVLGVTDVEAEELAPAVGVTR